MFFSGAAVHSVADLVVSLTIVSLSVLLALMLVVIDCFQTDAHQEL